LEEVIMRTSRLRFFAVAAVAALALAACSSSDKTASPATNPTSTTAAETPTTSTVPPTTAGPKTVSLASSSLGQILVDSKGMTLYIDENDKPGAPACTAACLAAWPPLAAPAAPTFGPGLDASKFATVTAADGTKQLAVDGFPLYLWVNDTKAGDVTGQGVNGFYVVGADYKKVEDEGS
jgi:predicted lipoprotein with Yx(FWY)xxD motif